MRMQRWVTLGALVGACWFAAQCGVAQQAGSEPLVRLAEISVDPAQVEAYRAALREEIAASIRKEPGVLKLYALAVKGHPEQIRMVEVYRDQAAYEAHLRTPHFLRYKAVTQGMVRSLRLVETEVVAMGER